MRAKRSTTQLTQSSLAQTILPSAANDRDRKSRGEDTPVVAPPAPPAPLQAPMQFVQAPAPSRRAPRAADPARLGAGEREPVRERPCRVWERPGEPDTGVVRRWGLLVPPVAICRLALTACCPLPSARYLAARYSWRCSEAAWIFEQIDLAVHD